MSLVSLAGFSAVVAAVVGVSVPAVAQVVSPIRGGDLLVMRLGDGDPVQGSGSRSASTFIDNFRFNTTSGQWELFQSIAMPTAGDTAFTINQNARTEGTINMSADGNYLVMAGYRRDVQAGSPGALAADVAPRVAARVGLDGSVDTSTVLRTDPNLPADLFSTQSIRGAASYDGNQFWVTGANGVVYAPGVGPSVASVSLAGTNSRGIGIYGGQLQVDTQTTIRRWSAVTGELAIGNLPTTPGAVTGNSSFVNIAGIDHQNSVGFDLDPAIPGVDTVYFADAATSRILKYSLTDPANATTTTGWTANGTVTVDTAAFNLTGHLNPGGGVTLFYTNTSATPSTDPSFLSALVDSTGYNATIAGTGTRLAQSTANTAFRGVAYVYKPGDLNNDLRLNGDDFALIDRFVAKNGLGAVSARRFDGDLNSDGLVNAADYLLLDTAWGKQQGGLSPEFVSARAAQFGAGYVAALTAAVPEPGTAIALLAVAPGLAARRRR